MIPLTSLNIESDTINIIKSVSQTSLSIKPKPLTSLRVDTVISLTLRVDVVIPESRCSGAYIVDIIIQHMTRKSVCVWKGGPYVCV